jgi:hypothetical protein
MADKPRTIAAAKRAGSKYYYDKDGNKKLAVTAEELKASGMTLRQWANKAEGKAPKGATASAGSKPAPKRPADKTTVGQKSSTGGPARPRTSRPASSTGGPARSGTSRRTAEKPMSPDQKRRADLLQAVKDFFKSEYDK